MSYESILVQIGEPLEGSTIIAAGSEFQISKKELVRYNAAKAKASETILKKYRVQRNIKVEVSKK